MCYRVCKRVVCRLGACSRGGQEEGSGRTVDRCGCLRKELKLNLTSTTHPAVQSDLYISDVGVPFYRGRRILLCHRLLNHAPDVNGHSDLAQQNPAHKILGVSLATKSISSREQITTSAGHNLRSRTGKGRGIFLGTVNSSTLDFAILEYSLIL